MSSIWCRKFVVELVDREVEESINKAKQKQRNFVRVEILLVNPFHNQSVIIMKIHWTRKAHKKSKEGRRLRRYSSQNSNAFHPLHHYKIESCGSFLSLDTTQISDDTPWGSFRRLKKSQHNFLLGCNEWEGNDHSSNILLFKKLFFIGFYRHVDSFVNSHSIFDSDRVTHEEGVHRDKSGKE